MKKILVIGLIALIVVGCNQSPPSPAKKYIEWGSDNEIADAMVMKGLFHFVNIEREMAIFYDGLYVKCSCNNKKIKISSYKTHKHGKKHR